MSNKMVVVVNGIAELEYHRDVPLPGHQQDYLRRMDEEMDRGIPLDGEMLANPDLLQRARYVAMSLVESLQQDQEARIAATLAWLAVRIPDLQQLRVETGEDGQVRMELVFDRPLENQVKVQFPMPGAGETRH